MTTKNLIVSLAFDTVACALAGIIVALACSDAKDTIGAWQLHKEWEQIFNEAYEK